jgi:hypothetical protein
MTTRWERRDAKREANRRRMPKHGLGYVRLVQRVLHERGQAARRAQRTEEENPAAAGEGKSRRETEPGG